MEIEIVDHTLIKELRTKLMAKIQDVKLDNQNDIYLLDIQRIENDDNWLSRYILHQEKNVEKAFQMAMDCLMWRKDNSIRDISDTNLPQLFFKINAIYTICDDKFGCKALMFHLRLHIKNKFDAVDVRRYILYWIEKLEVEGKGHPISLLIDGRSTGYKNIDFELAKFLLNIFKLHYPYFLGYVYIFEMPTILTAAWKILRRWLNPVAAARVKFVDKNSIKDFFNVDELPPILMDGTVITN